MTDNQNWWLPIATAVPGGILLLYREIMQWRSKGKELDNSANQAAVSRLDAGQKALFDQQAATITRLNERNQVLETLLNREIDLRRDWNDRAHTMRHAHNELVQRYNSLLRLARRLPDHGIPDSVQEAKAVPELPDTNNVGKDDSNVDQPKG